MKGPLHKGYPRHQNCRCQKLPLVALFNNKLGLTYKVIGCVVKVIPVPGNQIGAGGYCLTANWLIEKFVQVNFQ